MENEINQEQQTKTTQSTKGKSKLIIFVVGLILVVSAFVLFNFTKSKMDVTQNNDSKVETIKPITLQEVAVHNSKESCWTAINNEVFDVTSFISKHKGGDKILAVCGIDGTDLFTGKSPLGRVHSEMAAKILSSMKIGTLSK